jgi:hypothetical protein
MFFPPLQQLMNRCLVESGTWVDSSCHSSLPVSSWVYSRSHGPDLILISSVNIKGLLAPNVTIETVAFLRQYSLNLSVIRKVWGGICVASDGIIMLTCKSHAYLSFGMQADRQ